MSDKRKLSNEELEELCDCANCPLNTAPGPVFGHGPNKPVLTLIAEAPGRTEADDGFPMVGPSGKLSDDVLKDVGTKRENVHVTNMVLCRPTDANDKDCPPPAEAIQACSKRLKAELLGIESEVAVAVGGTAAKALLSKDDKTTITSMVGDGEWRYDLNKYVIPTIHPAYALRGKKAELVPLITKVYKQALLMAEGEVPLPEKHFKLSYEYCTDDKSVSSALYQLEAAIEQGCDRIALDTETQYAGDPSYELLTVQVSTGDLTFVLEAEPLIKMKKRFAALLTDSRVSWVFHNLSFDGQYLAHNFGALPAQADDTMCLALCLTEKAQEVGLKALSRQWLGASTYEEDIHKYPTPSAKNPWGNVPRNILVPYGASDAYYTYKLYGILKKQVDKAGNYWLYENILLPAQRAFIDMEMHGILIDLEHMKKARAGYQPIIDRLEKACQDYAKKKGFDPAKYVKKPKSKLMAVKSVPQKKGLFYDVLKLAPAKDKKGKVTTGEEFYKKYPKHEVTKMFKEHGHVSKMVSTYITGVEDDIHPDNRVRPSFKIYGATTGRLSASDPPIQTLPKDKNLKKEIGDSFISLRKAYIAPEGYVFCEADYTALELYIAYHYSGDVALYNALKSGDFHTQAASNAFNVAMKDVDSRIRDASKCITYGVMYRLQAKSLKVSLADEKIVATEDQCQEYIDNWFAGFPQYHEWWQATQDSVMDTGKLTTAMGRIRVWDYIDSTNEDRVKNQAVNFPIQSLANDLCLMALIKLNTILKEKGYGHVIITVHDSIEFELKKDTLHEAVRIIHDVMSTPSFETPIDYFPISVEIGPDWASLEKMELEYARSY